MTDPLCGQAAWRAGAGVTNAGVGGAPTHALICTSAALCVSSWRVFCLLVIFRDAKAMPERG